MEKYFDTVNHDKPMTLIGRTVKDPENWEEYYKLWLDKKITAKEFMLATKLKRTNFYKLLHKYQNN